MSGDGGNPPSLRDLLGAYEKSGLSMKEYNSTQGKQFGDVSQKNLDIGNQGSAIYGFKKFVQLMGQTQW